MLGASSVDPVVGDRVSTEMQAYILERWVYLACDPDIEIPRWLMEGAPAGIRNRPKDCGIFPPYDASELPEADNPEELVSVPEDFHNHPLVEQDKAVGPELGRLCDEKYVQSFPSWDALVSYLGENPILSKMAVIVKWKNGKEKKRIVLNTRSSGVSESSAKSERGILPI